MSNRESLRLYGGVAACAVVVYLGALWNAFAWDDIDIIAQNDLVHSWSGLWRAFVNPYWPPAQGGFLYRPLTIAGFVLDWQLGGAAWFHAVNVVWHAGVAVLVAVLLQRWAGAAAALVGGLLFAVHPVHVEAVANVVGRAELMAAAFGLLAVYAAIERDSVLWCAACFALGLLSKENAAVVPALIVAAWALGLGRPAPRRAALFAASWTALGAAYVLVRGHVLGPYHSFIAPVFVGQGPVTVRLTAIAALADVTRVLVLPLKLRADYSPEERTPVASALDGRFLAGVISLVAWGLWFALARRRGRRVEMLGISWIGLAFAPVANLLFPTGILVAERTLYFPSVGLALAVGAVAAELRGRALALCAAAVAVAGGVRTALRVPAWRDEATVVESILKDSPHSYVGFGMVASRFLMERQDEKALQAAQVAIRMVPSDTRIYLVAAHAALKLGQRELAGHFMHEADRACSTCALYYQVQANFARQMGDQAVAESLLAHASRGEQR